MKCRYCGGAVELKDSSVIYGRSYGNIYICDSCKAFVGCHKGTDKPLGTLANDKLRQYRKEAHKWFDQLWKCGYLKRSFAYFWLSSELKLSKKDTHIAMFDIEECKKTIKLSKKKLNELYLESIEYGDY